MRFRLAGVHFRITRDFLNAPERFHRYLFEDEDGEA